MSGNVGKTGLGCEGFYFSKHRKFSRVNINNQFGGRDNGKDKSCSRKEC